MLLKEDLKSMKKVSVFIVGSRDNKFKNGRRSQRAIIYQTTPDEVLDIIKRAIREK